MRVFIVTVSLILQLAHAGLEFESKLVEVNAAADDKSSQIDFKFTNKGKDPVFISHIDPDCDCLTIMASGGTTLADKRIRYRPGESGIIRSQFKIGNKRGQLDHNVMVWLTGDPKDEPSIQLKARINVPQLITMIPRTLKWEVGEQTKAKSVEVIMNHDRPIQITETKSTSPNFTIEMAVIEKGKHYTLSVVPKDTSSPGIGVIQILTDSDIEIQSREQVFAMVHRP
ncbi:MAG: DUF1573 domain-containing protein [Luteolibacter sp.]